jgi:hypothetical protein
MKINAQTLALAGYTEAQIDRYYTLLARKQKHGQAALSPDGRRFMINASTAIKKFETQRQADLVAAAKRKVTGKQPVENKLHYRWCVAETELIGNFLEMSPGEVSAYRIIKEEEYLALSKYQPVLHRPDAAQRHKFNVLFDELSEVANALTGAREAQYNGEGFVAALRGIFEVEGNWKDTWDKFYQARRNVVFADTDETEFRAYVKPLMESATRTIYTSVKVA